MGFIFAVPSWHARQNLPAGECTRWRQARRSIRFVLRLFLGGGLVEDHDAGGMIPDLVQTLVITLVTFAILELQPLFKYPNGPNRQYLACPNPVLNAIGQKTTPASIP